MLSTGSHRYPMYLRQLALVVSVPASGDNTGEEVDPGLGMFWILLSFLGLSIVFHAIYVLCDEHLVPGKNGSHAAFLLCIADNSIFSLMTSH